MYVFIHAYIHIYTLIYIYIFIDIYIGLTTPPHAPSPRVLQYLTDADAATALESFGRALSPCKSTLK